MRIASYLYEYPEFVYPDETQVVSYTIRLGYSIVSDIRPIRKCCIRYGICHARKYQSAGVDPLTLLFRVHIRVDTTRYEVKAPDTFDTNA